MFLITSVKGKQVATFGYYREMKVVLGFFFLYITVPLWGKGGYFGHLSGE